MRPKLPQMIFDMLVHPRRLLLRRQLPKKAVRMPRTSPRPGYGKPVDDLAQLLQPLIERTLAELNHPMHVIDSAAATAACVAEHFPANPSTEPATTRSYATDSIEKFQRLGSSFLGQTLDEVHLLDLGG